MSQYETIKVSEAAPLRTITLARPEAMNSLTQQMRRELGDALRKAKVDDSVRAVILTGEGRAFSAGADLKEFQGDKLFDHYTVEEQLNIEYKPIFDAINTMDKPVLAAVNGSAAGVALSLVLSSDVVFLADSAFLLSPFTTISLVGDGGANWLLARQLGYHKAFELSVLSERIKAEQALAYGLANRVVAAADLSQEVEAYAMKLAERAPLSIAATKKALRFAADHTYDETFAYEAALQRELLFTEDNVEGVNAFLEKRAPTFKGK